MPPKRKPSDESSGAEKKTKVEEVSEKNESELGTWLDELFAKSKLEELAAKGKTSDYKEYEALFLAMTERLYTQCVLVVNGKAHRFIEVEFYYKFPSHPDPFTHCHAVQSEWGKWYFHRMGHGSNTYKAGSYKGLDISFGGQTSKEEKKKKAFGGILIRGIQPLFDFTPKKAAKGKLKEGFIEGPCNVVDHILALAKATSIEQFTAAHFKGSETSPPALSSMEHGSSMFCLRPPTDAEKKKIRSQKIYTNPRVGLSLKRSLEHGAEFILKDYRYHCLPQSVTKGKQHMILGLHHIYKLPSAEVARLTSTGAATVNKYIAQFKLGQKSAKTLQDMGSQKKLSAEDFNQMYGKWAATYSK